MQGLLMRLWGTLPVQQKMQQCSTLTWAMVAKMPCRCVLFLMVQVQLSCLRSKQHGSFAICAAT